MHMIMNRYQDTREFRLCIPVTSVTQSRVRTLWEMWNNSILVRAYYIYVDTIYTQRKKALYRIMNRIDPDRLTFPRSGRSIPDPVRNADFLESVTVEYMYSVILAITKILSEWKYIYEGCSKWIAYFYLETSNFKLAQKYSFHALEVLPVARNAKFQPMYPLLEGVTVRWFGHST